MKNLVVKAFFLGWVFFHTVCSGTSTAADKYRVYIGTAAEGAGQGVFISELNMKTGQLSEATLAVEARRSGIVTLNSTGTHLYATGQPTGHEGPRSGSVCAYAIDRPTGALTLLNVQETGSIGPCYLQLDSAARNILVCHYMGGACCVLPIDADGSLTTRSFMVQHEGSSVHPTRQNAPHPHAIVLDVANRYALVPDLGLDRVMIYRFDPVAGTITPNDPPYSAVKPGGGPRHLAFHPTQEFVYVNLEMTSEVTAFRYDAENGTLTEMQTLSTLPEGYDRMNANAGICVTPDGRFLYVTNRGHNSIAMYAVNPENGKLSSLGFESTQGDVPQTIATDPEGRYIITTDRNAGHVRGFRIDEKTGLLAYTGCTLDVPNVNVLVFQLR